MPLHGRSGKKEDNVGEQRGKMEGKKLT